MHVPRFSWRPRWFIDDTVLKREGDRGQGRKLTYKALELGSNNFSVTLVAALGFFTSSYLLYTSNNTLPMLGYIYWRDATKSSHETDFIEATTAGSIVGMIFFGLCCDRFGRRKLYGFDTIILIAGTIGVVMSSAGYIPQIQNIDTEAVDYSSFGSMNIEAWLLFWRVVTGIGAGGDYSCSSVIISEFAPTLKRPQLLAIVFAMQSLGNATGAVVSLVVLKVVQARHPYDLADPEYAIRAVDQIWRWVIGLGLIPAVLTAIMRFTIPESPRYTLDVLNDPSRALVETNRLKDIDLGSEIIDPDASRHFYAMRDDQPDVETVTGCNADEADQNSTCKQYFWTEGNWRYILATSLSWFLANVATNALGLNQSQNLSKFWYGPTVLVKSPKVWDSDTVDPNASIFTIVQNNCIHLLAIISAPSVSGSILLVIFITRINRRLLLWTMFIVMGCLFIITGTTLLKASGAAWGVTIATYAVANLALEFSLGPLTFLIPAELFPTRYRTTCHGISAASGRLGTIFSSIFLRYVTFGGGSSKVTPSSSSTSWLGYVFVISSIPLFLGAIVSWLWIPELQHSDNKSKTLELLAEGRKTASSNDI